MNLPNNGVISQHVRDGILASREEWPVHSNRASEIGNPCHRYLYYMRTAYKERPLPDVGLLEISRKETTRNGLLSNCFPSTGLN